MSNESLMLGSGNWAAKTNNLLGYVVGDISAQFTPREFTFSRGSTATFTNPAGVIQSSASGIARVQNNALLLEPQRTNSVLYSEAINSWSISGLTITDNNAISPRGTQDASYIQQTTGGNIVSLVSNNISVSSSQAQCVTFYAKPKEVTTLSLRLGGTSLWVGGLRPTFTLDLTNGTSSSVSNCTVTSINVGNGWYRYTIQTAATVAGGSTSLQTSASYVLSSNSGDGFYLWGVQWEQNANYATTYIQTGAATATRLVDTFTRNNIYTNGLISASGGTWYVELKNNVSYLRDVASDPLELVDAGANNGFIIRPSSVSSRLFITKKQSGVLSTLFTTTTDTVKIAIKWNGTSADVFVNGVKVVSATAFTTTIMENLNGRGNAVPIFIQAMALYPTPLSDAQCQTLTT